MEGDYQASVGCAFLMLLFTTRRCQGSWKRTLEYGLLILLLRERCVGLCIYIYIYIYLYIRAYIHIYI